MEIAVIALALVGLVAVLKSSRRQTERAADGVRRAAGGLGSVFRVLVFAAVIVGVQWATATNAADDLTVLLPVLALPALFAGASIARLLTSSADRDHVRGGGW